MDTSRTPSGLVPSRGTKCPSGSILEPSIGLCIGDTKHGTSCLKGTAYPGCISPNQYITSNGSSCPSKTQYVGACYCLLVGTHPTAYGIVAYLRPNRLHCPATTRYAGAGYCEVTDPVTLERVVKSELCTGVRNSELKIGSPRLKLANARKVAANFLSRLHGLDKEDAYYLIGREEQNVLGAHTTPAQEFDNLLRWDCAETPHQSQ